ncbi:hypothetical protein B5M09_012899 [Aphanomyces astaci]|uniref:Uncharacterized protein n=1 Tax=Aphanomyces astaci TaxID=112090 RepID=A0A3R7X894_APHAT|nr:hypothetical protein B5M09_012899 [Aphanomyces astaci]
MNPTSHFFQLTHTLRVGNASVREALFCGSDNLDLHDVASIDQDHRDLVKAYKDEPGIKAIIDAHCNKTNFNDCWNCIGRARFSQLRRFCSGMAFVLAKTTWVESDFSILKWEKDEFLMNLLDLSLEGIFQAKQFKLLGPTQCPKQTMMMMTTRNGLTCPELAINS